jgi:hypothetical protein
MICLHRLGSSPENSEGWENCVERRCLHTG